MDIRFRRATQYDSALLLEWRNDPLTREQSLQTGKVEVSAHELWFAASLASPDRLIEIAEVGGQAMGMVRFDRRDQSWELSWSVAPEARGRGLGKEMVKLAAHRWTTPLIARIKEGNGASEAVARHAGFQPFEIEEGVRLWRRPQN